MAEKTIVVPNRDKEGWLHGTKVITVKWDCPTCGEPMGEEVKLHQFCEEGDFFTVHVWDNPCGHVAHYRNLKEVDHH